MKKYFFEKAWVTADRGGEWQQDVMITVDDHGIISSLISDATTVKQQKITGFALPAFANSHSHAFQRLLTGRTECRHPGEDNFWSWRELMYRFATLLTPEDLKNIAAFVYLEMLKAGYGAVAEFHYLHHQPSGQAYDTRAELSLAIIAAADKVGITLTHLPVLYQRGGFDNRPLNNNQRRFYHDSDAFLRLVDNLYDQVKNNPSGHRLGVAFHSLRAVPAAALKQVLAAIDPEMPCHIHIAEQLKEVEDCQEHTGQRPLEWLMSHIEVNHRWCLVHATHMTAAEITAVATAGAVVSLCPSTEANLGDGLFPLAPFLDAGGRVAIGSDSNSLIDPIEESRWLEYGARLHGRRRNIAAHDQEPHTGTALFSAIQRGGAQALGQKTGMITVGQRADIMVVDDRADSLCALAENNILDALIFAGNRHDIRHVMVAGTWVITDRHHPREDDIRENYQKTVRRLVQKSGNATGFI
ncbi:MAG: formimidoylglutamate deiminase [Alphaproteobacteria bacterium]|nr:formimidoylglutamate deiminase [Alphaproteobacteria bacterium]